MDDTSKLLGCRIRALRQARKLSLTEFAREIGRHRMFIHYIETDQRNPSLDTLERISDYFDVPIGDFFPDNSNIS